jgi:cathepsin L
LFQQYIFSLSLSVKAQGGCGSCWAFATVETVESFAAIKSISHNQSMVLNVLSPQQLVSCAPNPRQCGGTGGCGGSTPELAMEYLAKAGAMTESVMPYMSSDGSLDVPDCDELYNGTSGVRPSVTITGYETLPSNKYEPVMQALVTKGPLIVTVQASFWFAYSHGVADPCTNKSNVDINHAVQLVGYGSQDGLDYWLVRNSWGAEWGEGGYIKIKRGPDEEENCAWDLAPEDGLGCAADDDMPEKSWVCGTCGILYDVSYPVGVESASVPFA